MNKKRSIVVPVDMDAQKALNYDCANEKQIIQLIINEKEFFELNNDSFFQLINEMSGSTIDDFEDYVLYDSEKIVLIINVLTQMKENFGLINREIINNIIMLFKEALKRNTSIWFFF